jgi:catechol 2,3-dioxygenase-like lactoylglutathione lyase family enzyme
VSISLLYGCFQIETSVRDLDTARSFMHEVLGAQPIEQKLAREITDLFPHGGYRVDHLDCGRATFQLNEPSPGLTFGGRKSVHQQYLDRVGPCVSNLNFYVDDIGHARRLLEHRGVATLTEGPSTVVSSLADYGPANTRPGGEDRPYLFMATRPLIGLDLEIMEPNFLRFADQTAQYPCYVRPPERGDTPLLFQRLRLLVSDLEETHSNMVALFAPGSRSNPYALAADPRGRSFRIWLGGIELEYHQPSDRDTAAADRLARYGPGVTTVDFSAPYPSAVLERAGRWSARLVPTADERGADRHRVDARDIVGFDVLIEAKSSDALAAERRPTGRKGQD